jgi:hypothetical protein
LALRPERTVAHAKVGIGYSAADCGAESVDVNDRNASRLWTEHLTRAAKVNKFDKHAKQKESRHADYYGNRNREYQVDGSDHRESSLDRRS